MEFIDRALTKEEILELQKTHGDHVKLTVDLEREWVVAGGELHTDGERVLLEKGSRQDDVWGGGISFESKQVDTTAVLNLRPRLNNDSLEILDNRRREEFIRIVRRYFDSLWF